MENLSDPHALYQEFLQTSFEKLKKALPRKYKEINDMIATSMEELKHDKGLSANKYFGIYKLCIDTKDTKLIETAIYYIHKLLSHGYLDGNCRDYTLNLHLEENKNNKELPKNRDRQLIDSIVESVCSCRAEKNESVQLQAIKVLLTLMTSLKFEVHGESVQEIIHTLFTIHLTSKNTINQGTARAALTQIINAIFQRMEEYNASGEDYVLRKKNIEKNGATSATISKNTTRRTSLDIPKQEAINPYPVLSPVDRSGLTPSNQISQ